MLVCQKRWELVLNPEELVYRIVVPLPFLAFHLIGQEPIQDAGRQPLRGRLAFHGVLVQLSQIPFPAFNYLLLMRRRFVIELRIVAGNAELLGKA